MHESDDAGPTRPHDVPGVLHLGWLVRHVYDVALADFAFHRHAGGCRSRRDDNRRNDLAVFRGTDRRPVLCHAAALGGAAYRRRSGAFSIGAADGIYGAVQPGFALLPLLHADDGADQLAGLPADA